ncbi:hypothetical protein LINGRAHAP2_LOCUS452 [Linum grandiflorum]
MDKRPWHFNGVLLVVHELQSGESPEQVPLTHIPFWVHVHKLPFGYFSESVGRALGDFVGCYLSYDENNAIVYLDAYMRIRVMLDVRAPLQKERLVELHGGKEVNCLFRYERLYIFCFVCGILGHKEHQCELRYGFSDEKLSFLWDDSINAVSQKEARTRTANLWLRVRATIDPSRKEGPEAHGREWERFHAPKVPANVQALAICMGANAWDEDKRIPYPHMVASEAGILNLDEKKRRRTEDADIELMDAEDNPAPPPTKRSPNKQTQAMVPVPPRY